jgi:hypothetical protein
MFWKGNFAAEEQRRDDKETVIWPLMNVDARRLEEEDSVKKISMIAAFYALYASPRVNRFLQHLESQSSAFPVLF